MRISKYVTLAEAIKSQTATRLGISNMPNDEQLANMKLVGSDIFDPSREYVNGPLHASSFFRSLELNSAIGGSSTTSQHMKGEAVDMDCDTFGYGNNNDLLNFIMKNLVFDQLIGEYPDASGKFSWVHASKTKGKNRGQVLVKLKDKYIPFIEWKAGMV